MTEQQLLQTYRETVHPLYGYTAKRTGGNRELTEDVVQEAYLRALDTWNVKKVPDSPLAWLKRVARNILIDYLRQNKWEHTAGGDPHPETDRAAGKDQFESLEMFLAITSLGRKKARILEAFYYDGLSVREIASEMAISERAVEGSLRRARQALKSLLPHSEPTGGEDA
jgi:RNA polymerase sigma-70 factor (ECF subfamily)